jgi:RND family efflux transporter MFP subunit
MPPCERSVHHKPGSRVAPALFIIACACGSSSKATPSGPGAATDTLQLPTVSVITVTAAAGRRISVPGELRSWQEARLFARVNGFVDSVLVDRGSKVHRGQTLARIVAPELTAQIAEAASRAEAAAGALAEAEARYEGSSASYNRVKSAAATAGVVSTDELAHTATAARADSARLTAARSQESAAQAAHRAAIETGGYLIITAPFDGVITERNVSPGALVGAAGGAGALPMFGIEDDSRLRLVVALPEAYVGSTINGSASFQVRALPADTFRAVLSRRARELDPRTRAELLEFDVSNPDGRLEAGMYADVFVPVPRPSPTITVPSAAVGTSVDGPFVIAMIGDTTHWVHVRKGDAIGDQVEVFGDLQVGERVVARATDEIRTGVRVRAVLPDPPKAGVTKP